MISTLIEGAVPISKASTVWPTRQCPHLATLHRWRLNGVRSSSGRRVFLQVLKVGGKIYLSLELILKFIEETNDATVLRRPTTESSESSSRAAGKALEALGG